ncbi:hypothetical protein PHAVU_007G141600 [Phaseolus vulgaris]|uniref:Uncharacterized protein n=1 Tax=Phaseolus vulgaris TaxID=3885 RepID=V7BFD3_PHAVU|nr:hypothetical protein PHAVU_007G141600g [Phaseolus vulgaris]ESW16255.1 hypothetical protein PHAVU_007G141600g [Phaseolus vulgaris]
MSTDFHLHHDLPKLRIAAVKIEDVPSDHHLDALVSSVVTREENESHEEETVAVTAAAAVAEEDESYRTPTSKESKIPAIMTCPPAPRKPKAFASCKRKLFDDFQFFDVTNKEDMDAFFRSTFPKRSCTCT